jgi:predicted small lipoprotein YifL
MKALIAVLFGLLGLTGCGQRGPLFLPQETPAETVPPAREDLNQQPTEQ